MSTMRSLTLCLPLALLGACALGPDYKKPNVPVPAEFRQAQQAEGVSSAWKSVDVLRKTAGSGAQVSVSWWEQWWNLPEEDELAQLLSQVAQANPNVELVAAQYRQADALLSAAKASWWPSFSASAGQTRGQGVVGSSGSVTPGGNVRVTDKVAVSTTWELDLWGRIARGAESNEAAVAASAADLRAAVLSAQMAFAQAYLQWQTNGVQQQLLNQSVAAYTRSLGITRSRYEAGVAPRSDVLQAETQLNTTKAQLIDLGIQQAQMEHAMAVLLGKPPMGFSLPSSRGLLPLPNLPQVLPTQLLLSRPDIAAAERRVAAANAQIGVAQAAFFPALTLGGSLGYQDTTFKDIISAPNRYWSFGPSLALTLFDGGARSAAKAQAEAVHDQRTASYRQTVLTAFQEVEDQLATLRVLAAEQSVQESSTASAREALSLVEHQYAAGTVSYLNVTAAQATALTSERSLLDVQLRRLLASLGLIKALGGTLVAS